MILGSSSRIIGICLFLDHFISTSKKVDSAFKGIADQDYELPESLISSPSLCGVEKQAVICSNVIPQNHLDQQRGWVATTVEDKIANHQLITNGKTSKKEFERSYTRNGGCHHGITSRWVANQILNGYCNYAFSGKKEATMVRKIGRSHGGIARAGQ